MENSRRPFDRSRELGPKKPRLMEEPDRALNPTVRQFPQRQVSSGITKLSSTRFKTNHRDLGSSDGGYQPQPLPFQELVAQYKSALAELTFNSKPIITNLTIIAGENQAAAKAVAATICANILEVPSEQKLPSLYLLDSIVKNIGRDYIKYFAARLPEVFCEAYRKVDPSVHQSMRHLFGTWKGVFPPQTLQAIERELDFTPAANGASSASATLRSDSQSQRPPHSIHVNPKYFERQHLQQSSRTKGGVDDMSRGMANSYDNPQMPEQALGVSRPWMDPSVTNNQHTHRDAFNDSVLGKSINASYRDNEYGSDLPRNLGMGIDRIGGRVTELGRDRSWYSKAGGGDVAGTISGQRNGFSVKHSFSNTEASMILDAHHQPTQNITSIQRSVVSNSWKNSEEEEFMWDEVNTGLTTHGAASVSNNLNKVVWTDDDDDENLEVEDNHYQIRNSFEANVDREMTIESQATEWNQLPVSRHHPSLSWQFQEQHSVDEVNQKPGHTDRFVSTLGTLPTITSSSAARMGIHAFLPNATIGLTGTVGQQSHSVGAESPSGQSPVRQQFLLPVGNLRRSQLKDFQGPFSSKTFQPRHQRQTGSSHTEISIKTKKAPLSKAPLAREISEKSTTGHLEASAVKSGLFSNMPVTSSLPASSSFDTGNLPSQLGVQSSGSGPSPVTLLSPVSAITSTSSLGPPGGNSYVPPIIPQKKAGQPPSASAVSPASSNTSSASAQTSNATNNTLNPIANLLSSLVAKGLISSETKTPAKVPSEILTRLEDQSDSSTTCSSLPVASVSGTAAVTVLSTKGEVVEAVKAPISLSKSTNTEIRSLIGFEFKPDVIRKLHPSVISELFDDFPHNCSICRLRLKFQEQFNRHLEWHATRESEHNGQIRASRWYLKSSNWIVGKAEYPSENESTDSVDTHGKETDRNPEDAMVLADENQCLCLLCGELFEDFYCQENGEWMFKEAVYMTNSDSNSERGIKDVSTGRVPIIHARCSSENSISSVLKMEQD